MSHLRNPSHPAGAAALGARVDRRSPAPRRGLSRRRFLEATAAGVGALALGPGWLAAQDGCEELAELSRRWGLIKPMLAERYHRLNHVLFHYLRNNWARLPGDKKTDIGNVNLGWVIERPSLRFAPWDTERGSPFWASDNHSGEDFLYYHRWMIAEVDGWLAEHGLRLRSWRRDSIPMPGEKGGCPDEKVPDFVPVFAPNVVLPFLQKRVREVKSDAFYWSQMAWWGQEYRDPAYLRTLTLGELGSRMEATVHNQMHIRWSDYPSNPGNPDGLIRPEGDIDKKWDHPDYDTVFDEYSSHIHPLFFRLHKWLDNRINDWADAHGDEVERYRDDERGFEWFRPGKWVALSSPWVGANGFTPKRPGRIAEMEEIFRIFTRPEPGVELVEPEAQERQILSIRDLV